jgi:hypothetical protein
MAEPIIEQIAAAIVTAIDDKQDPDVTFTTRAVRPKIIDWNLSNFEHADVIIELVNIVTQSKTTVESRRELATFKLLGIVRDLPADTAADTVVSRMGETIRREMFKLNSAGQAISGKGLNVDSPSFNYAEMPGGLVAEITVTVLYQTALADGYAAPNE